MAKPLSHYRRRIAEKGVTGIVSSRYSWYKFRLGYKNQFVGRIVELFGNRVRIGGMTFSVDCPQLPRGHKSALAVGLYEAGERTLITRWVPRDLPVLEFGGGLGVTSCILNRKLADPFRHVVVEANPEIIPLLEYNRNFNDCKFKIINKAVAYDCDYTNLEFNEDFSGNKILEGRSSGRSIRVKATTVSSLLAETNFCRAGLVCDIEGGEEDIISREMPILGDRIKFFLAEMHPHLLGEDTVRKLMNNLVALGFTLREQIGSCVFFDRDS
jgi:FkbM family methyltransferase